MARARTRSKGAEHAAGRVHILQAVQTPLGFFVLVVLIVEAIMGASLALMDSRDRLTVIFIMAALIGLLVATVTGLAVFRPQALNLSEQKPEAPSSVSEKPAMPGPPPLRDQVKVAEEFARISIRCSLSALVRIEVDDRYLLVRGERIKHQFQPVGGVYKRYQSSSALMRRLGVEDDKKIPIDEDSKGDLRIHLPGEDIPAFLDWFDGATDRETHPWREFYEELVVTGLVPAEIFPYIHCSFSHRQVNQIRWSEFTSCHELLIADVFCLHPNNDQVEVFRKMQKEAHDEYKWVSHLDILKRGPVNGVATIADNARWLF